MYESLDDDNNLEYVSFDTIDNMSITIEFYDDKRFI